MSADFILMCVWSSFLFKPETAYEMRISDWSSTCALPISRAAIHRKTSRHAGWLPCQPASVVGRRPPGRSAPDDGQGAYLDALPWRRLGGGVGLLEGAVRREARAAVVEAAPAPDQPPLVGGHPRRVVPALPRVVGAEVALAVTDGEPLVGNYQVLPPTTGPVA